MNGYQECNGGEVSASLAKYVFPILWTKERERNNIYLFIKLHCVKRCGANIGSVNIAEFTAGR
jgi:hypothetical protein